MIKQVYSNLRENNLNKSGSQQEMQCFFCLEYSKRTRMLPKISSLCDYIIWQLWRYNFLRELVLQFLSEEPCASVGCSPASGYAIASTDWPFTCPPSQHSRTVGLTAFVSLFRDVWTNTHRLLHCRLWLFYVCRSSSLSPSHVILFIQLDTCRFGNSLLVKPFLYTIWNSNQSTMELRRPHILK